MYTKRMLVLSLCFILFFSFCSTSVFATDTIEESSIEEEISNTGLLCLNGSVPENFEGTLKVVLYEIEEQEELIYFLRSEDEYTSFVYLPLGVYKIATVLVSGGAEGCFETSFSTDTFIIDEKNTSPVNVSILLNVASEMQGDNSNNFVGMTYEEVMETIDKDYDSFSDTSDADKTIHAEIDNETIYNDNQNDDVSQIYHSEEAPLKNDNHFFSSFIVMCIMLIVSGVIFLVFKKKNFI